MKTYDQTKHHSTGAAILLSIVHGSLQEESSIRSASAANDKRNCATTSETGDRDVRCHAIVDPSRSVRNATNVRIEPKVGVVQPGGSRQVFPQTTSTYTLTATGTGGTAKDATSVSVTVPTPTIAATPPKRSLGELVSSQTKDAYFDFDKYNLRPDARTALTQDATALKGILKDFPEAKVTVEGHCDERGSAEYNLAPGDRRAKDAKNYLVEFGVPAARLATISYGKERPQCTENDEACWQRNRRAHLSPGQ